MKKRLIALLFAVAALAIVAPSIHAGTPTPAPKTPKKTPRTHTVIASVDASSITVKAGDQSSTYKITPQTEITFKGNPSTAGDLKPGMRVDVTAGMDAGTADRIAADGPPKDK